MPRNNKNPLVELKEKELRQSEATMRFYKKEIDTMRDQLEGSYNI
jgi:hypothetical protein